MSPREATSHAFAALCEWRDRVARSADVSIGRVLAGHALATIAKHLPSKQSDLLRYSRPTTAYVAAEQDSLLEVLTAARAAASASNESFQARKKHSRVAASGDAGDSGSASSEDWCAPGILRELRD